MSGDIDNKVSTIGERIRFIRGKRSPAEFALLIGKRKDDVFKYEANYDTPSLLTLSKIAEIGGVTVDWLFHGKKEKEKEKEKEDQT